MRVTNAARFGTLALSNRAKDKDSFRGGRSDFFISNLIDTLAAMLATKMSEETKLLR